MTVFAAGRTFARPGPSAASDSLPSIEGFTGAFDQRDGLLTVYWDEGGGSVYLELDDLTEPLLYRPILAGGLGSNDVGLDRGLFAEGRIVRFERIGRRVLLFEDNLGFRAASENADERQAVEDAFAKSVVFGFDVVAESAGRTLIDATDFVVRDAIGIARRLEDAGQGSYSVDASRSALNPVVVKSFPDNVELEAWLTFSGSEPGRFVRDVAPDPYSVTLRMRHSFVRLPDEGYRPRIYDPRSGYYGITYVDYATPVSTAKERRFIARHRLEVDGGRAVKPIVYYLDRGAPEPIRSALLDGARWWAGAFEDAGVRDAFRVELLPDDADPMDVRYNIIQWVHRSTRGWSWGGSLVDPRTGEIVKGHVALGSLRVRQDYLLALGLTGRYETGDGDPMLDLALSRIRQLSAHEVGHTLGLRHNFAASVSERASVMDYPAPLVSVDDDGGIDLSRAYAAGIGEWDKFAIRYGYTVFGSGVEETAGLRQVLEELRAAGLQYISDEGARPAGGAHPYAHLWDNGADPIEALQVDMEVRRRALAALGLQVLEPGRPVATVEEVLVPVYLRHRYQLEAVVKLVAGVDYEYAVAGSEFEGPTVVAPGIQRAAVAALLRTLTPAELEIPLGLRSLIPPRPPGFGENRELLDGVTGPVFDPMTPAVGVADFVFGLLLDPGRMARLVNQDLESPAQPGLNEVLRTVSGQVTRRGVSEPPHTVEIRRLVESSWVRALIRASSESGYPPVLSALQSELERLAAELEPESDAGQDNVEARHGNWLSALIYRYLDREYDDERLEEPVEIPPGSPIGSD